ncbi:hypothetical protein D3C81_1780790 [compost metagenome]
MSHILDPLQLVVHDVAHLVQIIQVAGDHLLLKPVDEQVVHSQSQHSNGNQEQNQIRGQIFDKKAVSIGPHPHPPHQKMETGRKRFCFQPALVNLGLYDLF